MNFKRVVIVGVGLLGGSLGLALKARGLAQEVVGWGRRIETLRPALDLKAVDRIETDLPNACQQADLVVVCTPVECIVPSVLQCLSSLAEDGLVTDVGSTKRAICDQLNSSATRHFCGSHPLAGSDKSGVAYATARLFEDRLTIITPTADTPPPLLARTERLWQAVGSRTLTMSPADHDQAVAHISHLPHIVAAALAAGTPQALLPLAASGWCDTTRVAGGGVELWRQILQENRGPILHALEGFAASLEPWIDALRRNDSQQLEQLLEAGKQKRDSVGN
jgi:prephenate dehydrogenase